MAGLRHLKPRFWGWKMEQTLCVELWDICVYFNASERFFHCFRFNNTVAMHYNTQYIYYTMFAIYYYPQKLPLNECSILL